jgi:hypothetical protein
MPSLKERTGLNLGVLGYSPVQPQPVVSRVQGPGLPSDSQEPGFNHFLRCPLPPIWQSSPDSLRQFYQNGKVPQTRIFNPPLLNGGNTGGSAIGITGSGSNATLTKTATQLVTDIVTQTVNTSVKAAASAAVQTALAQTSQATIQTTALSNGQVFAGTIALAKAFQLLNVSASSPCRIQLYGTALAQAGDAGRGLDVPPPAGSTQNIICDVVLDTSPLQWFFQSRTGANADSPQTNKVYVTITSLAPITGPITVNVGYA